MQTSRLAPSTHTAGPFIRGQVRRRYLGWTLAVMVLGVLAASLVTLAALTRPIARQHLPTTPEAIRQELLHTHRGELPCVRWSEDRALDDEELARFVADFEQTLTADLHVLLPFLALIRHTNTAWAERHHERPAQVEYAEAAVQSLPLADRVRVAVRPERLVEILPRLEHFETLQARDRFDAFRAERFLRKLPPEARERVLALIQRWRARLAGPDAQQSLIHQIAVLNTHQRLAHLTRALREYRARFGSWPADLPALLQHLEYTEQLTNAIDRGIETDGSLRDGWLRPFTYYAFGPDDFRLISSGPSDNTDTDDIVADRRWGGEDTGR